jgi:3-oxoacyl-[acyl-carrier protein] reductase
MKADLKDQVALVTGAARGIGLATARLLAENGARWSWQTLMRLRPGGVAAGMPGADGVADGCFFAEEVAAGVRELTQRLGRIDILVNNAGINTLRHRVTIDQFPIEEWDRIMAVDLRGVFLVSRAVSAVMIAQGGGRIVNIASVLGIVPARLQCAYTAAKAGVINLTQTMAIELAPQKISVNCVAPRLDAHRRDRAAFLRHRCRHAGEVAAHHQPHPGRPAGQGRGSGAGGAVLCGARDQLHYRTNRKRGWRLVGRGFLRDF